MRNKNKDQKDEDRSRHLRPKAEAKLVRDPKLPADMEKMSQEELIHELRVHQIELEMQNDELKSGQAMIEESRDKYAQLYDFAPTGYLTLSRDVVILEANVATAMFLGVDHQKLINQRFRKFIDPADIDRWDRYIVDIFQHDGKGRCELALKRPDGSMPYVQIDSVRIDLPAAAGQAPETVVRASMSDITERKNIDELKNQFISTVSHELRTPLAIIKEGVSLVLDGSAGPENEKQVKLLTTVKTSIDRLARLINSLLDISKLEAGRAEFKPVLVDFSVILRDICAKWKIETDKNCQGLEYCSPDLPINIYIDPDKLTQILDNLISNAIKFTPKEGKIKVELKDEKNQIEISISDTGIGIAKEDLPKVFGRFQQFSRAPGAGYKGTGLGLAIVKELIEIHKGEIKVESELNKGTKFIFTLPKIAAEEVFKEYISNGLKEAADRKSSFSLIVAHIMEFSQLQEKWGEKPLYLLTDIERVIKDSLRRRADTVLRSTGELIIFLLDTRKGDAEVVKKRIEEAIRTYLSQCKEEWIKEIRITLGTATFPEEANNHQELLDKARVRGGIKYKGVRNNGKKNPIH